MEAALFYIFAVGVLVAGAQVIFRRNPIYGALSLVGCFFFLAGIYVLLAAHLIAILQIMVYAGAVMVLFVFVIMLLNLKEEELGEPRWTAWKAIGLAARAGGNDVRIRSVSLGIADRDALAAALIEKGAFVLSPRGECYSAENIRERLGMRDFMEGLRGAGADIGGPAALSPADRQAFARQLDRFLARQRS